MLSLFFSDLSGQPTCGNNRRGHPSGRKKKLLLQIRPMLYFHELTKEQIEFYVDKYKPYDKAGAYAIQEWIGVVGIKSVNGDFYNVMGLPVSRVVRNLKKF